MKRVVSMFLFFVVVISLNAQGIDYKGIKKELQELSVLYFSGEYREVIQRAKSMIGLLEGKEEEEAKKLLCRVYYLYAGALYNMGSRQRAEEVMRKLAGYGDICRGEVPEVVEEEVKQFYSQVVEGKGRTVYTTKPVMKEAEAEIEKERGAFIAVSFHGGMAGLKFGPFDDYLAMVNEYIADRVQRYNNSYYTASKEGALEGVKKGYEGGVDIYFSLNKNFQLGLSADYLFGKKSSDLYFNSEYIADPSTINYDHTWHAFPEENLSILFLLLKPRVSAELSKIFKVFVAPGVGLAYYKAELNYKRDASWIYDFKSWYYSGGRWYYGWHRVLELSANLNRKFESKAIKPVVSIEAGVELVLSQRVGVILAGRYRYLKLNEIKATEYFSYEEEGWEWKDWELAYTREDLYYSDKFKEEGTLYEWEGSGGYNLGTNLSFWKPKSPSKASADLSGAGIILGIILKF